MTVDRVLAIVGIIIGIPAFLSLFFKSEHHREAILSLILIGVVIAVRWYLTSLAKKPSFTVKNVQKHFTIYDNAGNTAHFEGSRTLKANINGITEYWNRNLIQDGTISNIKMDGRDPDLTEIVSGTTHICKRFPRPLVKGEEYTATLSYDLHGSFCNPRSEGVIHNNPYKTNEVEIIVDLPRPCIKAEFRQTYIGEQGELLPPPRLSNGNMRITANVKKPLIGASYHLDWEW